MPISYRSLLSIFPIIFVVSTVWANNNGANVTSITSVQAVKKASRKWSSLLTVNRSTSMVDFKDGTRTDSMDYTGRFSFKIGENYSAHIQGGYSQDLNYPEYDDFSDTSLSFGCKPSKMGKRILLGYNLGSTIPTSKNSKIRQNLQTAVSASLNVIVNPDLLTPGFEISGGLGFGKNFHQFETALNGPVNTSYSARQSISLGYSFQSRISVSANFAHRNTWSYQNVMRDTFELSQEVGYQLNPVLAFAVGHTNSGSSLRPNGSDLNVQIIDENKSLVYGSVTAVF